MTNHDRDAQVLAEMRGWQNADEADVFGETLAFLDGCGDSMDVAKKARKAYSAIFFDEDIEIEDGSLIADFIDAIAMAVESSMEERIARVLRIPREYASLVSETVDSASNPDDWAAKCKVEIAEIEAIEGRA